LTAVCCLLWGPAWPSPRSLAGQTTGSGHWSDGQPGGLQHGTAQSPRTASFCFSSASTLSSMTCPGTEPGLATPALTVDSAFCTSASVTADGRCGWDAWPTCRPSKSRLRCQQRARLPSWSGHRCAVRVNLLLGAARGTTTLLAPEGPASDRNLQPGVVRHRAQAWRYVAAHLHALVWGRCAAACMIAVREDWTDGCRPVNHNKFD